MYIKRHNKIMQTIKVSATKARNDFFNLFNVVFSGTEVFVEKDKRQIIKMVPIVKDTRNSGLLKALDLASSEFSYSKANNPLRRKGAADFLGKWVK